MPVVVQTRSTTTDVFGARVSVPGMVNAVGRNSSPVISPDELELYFNSDRDGQGAYVATRTTRNGSFDTVRKLDELTLGTMIAGYPSLAANGRTLVFTLFDGSTERVYMSTRCE